MTYYWAIERAGVTAFSQTNGDDLAAEGIDIGDDREMIDRMPTDLEQFDWTTRAIVYRDPADVQDILLARVDAARIARLAHAEFLMVQFNGALDRRGVGFLAKLRYDEAGTYLGLTSAEKAALTSTETETQFPLLSITAYSLDPDYFPAEAASARGGEGYAKNFVILIEQVAKDAITDITAASTAADKIAAFDAIAWPLPAGQTLP